MSEFRFHGKYWALAALLPLSVLPALTTGAYDLDWSSLYDALLGRGGETAQYLLWNIRLPRIVMAAIVGAGLAVTGAAIQGLFCNPLADPALIGVTSGAMLFAVASLVFSTVFAQYIPMLPQQVIVSIAAFIGALLTTWLVYQLAAKNGRVNVMIMLLAGIAITSLAGAVMGLMVYSSDESQLRDITFWTLGSVSGSSWIQVAVCAPLVLLGTIILCKESLAMNALLFGEQEAEYLGFDVQATKRKVILWSALIVGAAVSVTGLIGFVGLVIPHLLRLLLGTDYRKLLFLSAWVGASFLVFADTLARTIVAPSELPIGILTASVGAPFFLWLLLIKQRSLHV